MLFALLDNIWKNICPFYVIFSEITHRAFLTGSWSAADIAQEMHLKKLSPSSCGIINRKVSNLKLCAGNSTQDIALCFVSAHTCWSNSLHWWLSQSHCLWFNSWLLSCKIRVKGVDLDKKNWLLELRSYLQKSINKQACIPVGCGTAYRQRVDRISQHALRREGVSAPGGCLLPGQCLLLGGYLLWGGVY